MFITPLRPIDSSLFQTEQVQNQNGGGSVFRDVFQNAVQDLKDTQAAVDQDSQLLATGQIDDLHTLGINTTKAYLAERLVVELRNRTLDAYSEIMRINI